MELKVESDARNYRLLDKLGEGTYGIVYRALEIPTGKIIALKRNKPENLEDGISAVNIREICFLKTLKHPNIISLQSVVLSENSLDLIFEFMNYDLRTYIDMFSILPDQTIQKILHQILSALYFCHSNRVIHRDLKPQNILVDRNNDIKIADFGLARSFQIPIKPYTPVVQTLWYRAPEVLLGAKAYTTAIDIWSVGCIFAEMITKRPIFSGSSEIDVTYKIFQVLGTPNDDTWPGFSSLQYYKLDFPIWHKVSLGQLYPNLSEEGLDLISRMICIDPDNRISTFDALNHVRIM